MLAVAFAMRACRDARAQNETVPPPAAEESGN
jgi:hypothetical protein